MTAWSRSTGGVFSGKLVAKCTTPKSFSEVFIWKAKGSLRPYNCKKSCIQSIVLAKADPLCLVMRALLRRMFGLYALGNRL